MNKDLIELQQNVKAISVIVKTEECKQLSPTLAFPADVSDKFLFADAKPPFADKIDEKSKKAGDGICYLVITDIDQIDIKQQNRYISLVKNRVINNYHLPDNCIIVFTVKNKTAIKKMSPDLYDLTILAL